MPTVLAISSFVAASNVGLAAITAGAQGSGCEVVAVPTVVFGRHPGWGSPGGFKLERSPFADILTTALEHPDTAQITWALTGYFASGEQVRAAAQTLVALRDRHPTLSIAVDPVMGDADTGLYVAPDVADALERTLLPVADLVLPNAWEAERLTGRKVAGPQDAVAAAQAFGAPSVISSIGEGTHLGAVYADPRGPAWFARHGGFQHKAPRGTGDLLSGAFVGARAIGETAERALGVAITQVYAAIAASLGARRSELAVCVTDLNPPVEVETLETGPASP